jgi:GNAT superfamily N-acetyltransferase
MFRVAEAVEADKQTVLAITLDAYREYEEASAPEFWKRYCDNIAKTILEDRSSTILLVRDKGNIMGSVIYCEPGGVLVSNKFPEMRLLAVPPQFRNQGLAGVLIEACERRAADVGTLTLHTTRLMTTAKAMYERRGYVRYPEIDFEPVPDFVVWGFRKEISQPFSPLNSGVRSTGTAA